MDASDSELLSLAQQAGRPCVVLYDSARAVVVDLGRNQCQWADALWALGVDEDAGVYGGDVRKEDVASDTGNAPSYDPPPYSGRYVVEDDDADEAALVDQDGPPRCAFPPHLLHL